MITQILAHFCRVCINVIICVNFSYGSHITNEPIQFDQSSPSTQIAKETYINWVWRFLFSTPLAENEVSYGQINAPQSKVYNFCQQSYCSLNNPVSYISWLWSVLFSNAQAAGQAADDDLHSYARAPKLKVYDFLYEIYCRVDEKTPFITHNDENWLMTNFNTLEDFRVDDKRLNWQELSKDLVAKLNSVEFIEKDGVTIKKANYIASGTCKEMRLNYGSEPKVYGFSFPIMLECVVAHAPEEYNNEIAKITEMTAASDDAH